MLGVGGRPRGRWAEEGPRRGGRHPERRPDRGWLVQVNGARSGPFSRPCGCPCPLIRPAGLTLAGLGARPAFWTLSSCRCQPAPLSAPGVKCFFSLSEGVWLTPGRWLSPCWRGAQALSQWLIHSSQHQAPRGLSSAAPRAARDPEWPRASVQHRSACWSWWGEDV